MQIEVLSQSAMLFHDVDRVGLITDAMNEAVDCDRRFGCRPCLDLVPVQHDGALIDFPLSVSL